MLYSKYMPCFEKFYFSYKHYYILLIVLLLMSTFLMLSSRVSAEPKWYLSGKIGGTGLSNVDATESNGTMSTVNLKEGFYFAGAFGAALTDSIRSELELSHKRNQVGEFDLNGINIPSVTGNSQVTSILANFYYDFLPNRKVRPYLSGGVGVSRVETNFQGPAGIFAGGVVSDDTDVVLSGQVGLGASIAISEKILLTGGYRYFMTDDLRLDIVSVDGLRAHEVHVGARLGF